MFLHADIKGADLPPRTLCLTYDDGPGPDSAALGRYLHQECIQATFFVIGRHAEQYSDSLAQLHEQGHLLGNHTYSHPGLVALAESGGDVVEEIALADAVIGPYQAESVTFLRAPYGNWRQETEPGRDCEHSIVAEQLDASGLFDHYWGPVNW